MRRELRRRKVARTRKCERTSRRTRRLTCAAASHDSLLRSMQRCHLLEAERVRRQDQVEGGRSVSPDKRSTLSSSRPTDGAPRSMLCSVPYGALAAAFAEIEATTKRLVILEILTKLFVTVIERSPDNFLRVIYLCINRVSTNASGNAVNRTCTRPAGLALTFGCSRLAIALSGL